MSKFSEIWKTLSSIDVSEKVEKKQNLSYLSWAWAWGVLMEHYPQASYEFHPIIMETDQSATVSVTVTIDECSRMMWLPVMGNRNEAIKNPDARKISDSKMRCLVKCLAMFGLGHYIYAGEDLPSSEPEEKKPKQPNPLSAMATSTDAFNDMSLDEQIFLKDTAATIISSHGAGNSDAAFHECQRLDNEERLAIWHLLPSHIRTEFKKKQQEQK